jgi:hypothetical protein
MEGPLGSDFITLRFAEPERGIEDSQGAKYEPIRHYRKLKKTA